MEQEKNLDPVNHCHHKGNPLEIQISLKETLKELSIYGTILVGSEGINGTIAAEDKENLNRALIYLRGLKGFSDLDIKFSDSKKNPFIRLKIKLKDEIVTIGDKSIEPNVGKYLLTKFRLGSHNRYIASIIVKTSRLFVFITLKLTNQVPII